MLRLLKTKWNGRPEVEILDSARISLIWLTRQFHWKHFIKINLEILTQIFTRKIVQIQLLRKQIK